MLALTATRVAALVVTAVLAFGAIDMKTYFSIVMSFGMAHYILSFIYARTQIRTLASHRRFIAPIAVVVGAGLLVVLWKADTYAKLVIYFAIHHVLNETYLTDAQLNLSIGEARFLRAVSIVFHAFLYFALLSNFEPVELLGVADARFLAVGLGLATVAMAFALHRVVRQSGVAAIVGFLAFEGVGLAAAIAVLMGRLHIHYLDVVFYHFAFWCFQPLPKLAARGGVGAAGRYLALTASLTLAFLAASPLGPVNYELTGADWFVQNFYVWSFVHITTAFALSKAQPQWITRWFYPRSRADVPAEHPGLQPSEA